ncbi:MAG: DUF4199 domain-containing protein [Bacteroidales bacterium]|nr:DUF4199 domain-containing protein [Bacteroidales bacterium]
MEERVNPFKRKYKYAADYGVILGGYIALFFILDYLFPGNVFVNIINTLGFCSTPIVCFYLARNYRDKAWNGYIRFGQVWSFGVWLFLFAALLMSVLYYVRYQFLQPDYISEAYNQALLVAEKMNYSKEQMDMLTANGVPTAIQLVLVYLWLYIIGGAVLFLLVSPMVVRKEPDDLQNTQDSEKTYEPYQDKNDSSESKL